MAKRNVFIDDPATIDAQGLQETIEQRARQLADTGNSDITMSDDDEDPDELRALAEIDGGSDVTFQVHRLLPVSAKGYIGSLSAAELSLAKIQEDYGAGRYRVRGIRSNGTYAGQRTIDIAAAPPKVGGQPQQAAPQNSMTDYLSLMEVQSQKRSDELKAWAAILAPVVVAIIPALLNRGSQGPTLADLTTTMMNMKNLNAPESGVSKFKELKEMLELTQSMKPDVESNGSTWVDLIRDGVKELAPMVPAIMGAAAARGQPPVSLGAQNGPIVAAQPVPQIEQPETEPDMLAWLKQQLVGLVHQASQGKDPSLYAEVVLDNLPAGSDPKQLRMLLVQNTWWETLSSFHPPVAPYKPWFNKCRAELLLGLDDMLGLAPKPELDPKPARPARPADMPTDNGESNDGE